MRNQACCSNLTASIRPAKKQPPLRWLFEGGAEIARAVSGVPARRVAMQPMQLMQLMQLMQPMLLAAGHHMPSIFLASPSAFIESPCLPSL